MGNQGRVTLKEIAERTGVSIGTVHCAIYGKKGVGEKTRQMILEEVKRSGFQLNENASLLKRGEQQILVVLPELKGEDGYYFRGIWQGIREAAESLSRSHFTFRYIEAPCHLEEITRELSRLYDDEIENIQSLITVSDDEESSAWTARFGKRGIPTIVISSNKEESSNVYCLRVNHGKAGRVAGEFMRHSLRDKQGKILVLTGNTEIYSNRKYGESFLAHIRTYCPNLEPVCIPGFGGDQIEGPVREALKEERFLGAFICNARNTARFCQVAAEFEQSQEMVVVGTDVFYELKPYFENGILTATIYQNSREQGKRSVEMMHEILIGNTQQEQVTELPIGLVMKYNYEFYLS